ncbi:MAG: UDP-N-acetylmuramoyl-L-alanine--D-glutamate ligase [Nitrospirae bacterium]|nr:UDP-N-acetylmuramoyl-L-alanine--D-glutamate ligase [Nitrospirota bacterium]
MQDFRGKKITVVGLAKSGVGAANLLHSLGAAVTVTDSKPESELAAQAARLSPGVMKALGSHPDVLFTGADLIVISPGVPLTAPPLVKAAAAGVEITGELELSYLLSGSPFIAITGTNGKSTTTTLVGLMLEAAGMKAYVGGNLGNALTDEPERLKGQDFIVAEVSSFQLETIKTFRPRVSALLNVTQDHMDRYPGMAEYADAKARVFMNQSGDDVHVANFDDAPTMALAAKAACRVARFSRKSALSFGVFVRDGNMVSTMGSGETVVLPISDIRIKGAHNVENALAAAAITLAAGAPADAVAKVLREFPGLEHRMEFVRELDGVTWYNDSKGTNVGAVEKSLEGFDQPIILIAGGLDKHSDFSPLVPLLRERVKKLILIGKAADDMYAALSGATDTVKLGYDMDEAVRLARASASPGDVVMLSPACASFDMFRNFEDRGRQFKEMVNRL